MRIDIPTYRCDLCGKKETDSKIFAKWVKLIMQSFSSMGETTDMEVCDKCWSNILESIDRQREKS